MGWRESVGRCLTRYIDISQCVYKPSRIAGGESVQLAE
jgi:hypothetical protein